MNKILDKIEEWFIYFISFAFMGWIYEVCIMHFELGYGFINRGFLFGPYIPLYGFGGLFILGTTYKIRNKTYKIGGKITEIIINVVLVIIISTLLELVASYIAELVTGARLWDYTDYGPNFEGRIALKSSIQFGLLGLVGLYLVYPIAKILNTRIKEKNESVYYFITYFIIIIFLLDVLARITLGSNYKGP